MFSSAHNEDKKAPVNFELARNEPWWRCLAFDAYKRSKGKALLKNYELGLEQESLPDRTVFAV